VGLKEGWGGGEGQNPFWVRTNGEKGVFSHFAKSFQKSCPKPMEKKVRKNKLAEGEWPKKTAFCAHQKNEPRLTPWEQGKKGVSREKRCRKIQPNRLCGEDSSHKTSSKTPQQAFEVEAGGKKEKETGGKWVPSGGREEAAK